MDIIRNNDVIDCKTTGTLIKSGYIVLQETYTVDEALTYVRKQIDGQTNIDNLYILNSLNRLIGVLSIRELLSASSNHLISNVMKKDVISFPADFEQETAANVLRDKDLACVPIVNNDERLIGIIQAQDVLPQFEASENNEKLSVEENEIDFHTNPFIAAGRRLPWLILLLFIGLISGGIIERFENTLASVVALAFFMPMIAGMTGNTGTQSLAVVVRGFVVEDINFRKSMKLLFRELMVGIIIGITCAIIISTVAYFWRGSLALGLVVGVSLLATLILGTLAGTIIPLLLYKFKVDPAVASGPLITTINDILSLLIYFGIATMFISKLV